jgi:hypothetical protein
MNDLSARVGADAKREKEAPGSSEPDSLCDALLFLAAFHNRAMTREAMLFGLPIKDNRLSIPLFDRAARRAGLEVESVERPLGEIPAFVLPAVLILQDQSARILSKIDTYRKKADSHQSEHPRADRSRGSGSGIGLSGPRLPRQAGCRERANACCRGGASVALVLERGSQVLGELQPYRHRGLHRQCARARRAAVHHERL